MLAWVTYLGALSHINALEYWPIPQSWPNVRCTTHGPSFARVRYIGTCTCNNYTTCIYNKKYFSDDHFSYIVSVLIWRA